MSTWDELNAALDQGRNIREILTSSKGTDLLQDKKEKAAVSSQEFWSNLQVNGLNDEPMNFVFMKQRVPKLQAPSISDKLMLSQLCVPVREISKPCFIHSSSNSQDKL